MSNLSVYQLFKKEKKIETNKKFEIKKGEYF